MVKIHSDVMENKRSKHYLAYFGRLNRGQPSFRNRYLTESQWTEFIEHGGGRHNDII
jgi:hypothetical protein